MVRPLQMIGETVSHYRILKKLGQGGMGVIYVAEDMHLARRVAIKFSSANPENAQYRSRFLREARAASAISHPQIASIYDYGETPDGRPFIVMELVEGEDLAHLLRRGPISQTRALSIAIGVATALSEAHRHGIIHRDIKPSNTIVTQRDQVKVLDFGLAKQISKETSPGEEESTLASSRTTEGMVVGTPLYMSPEQVRDMPPGPASDIFSLGAMLYECLARKAAFAGRNSVEIMASVLHVDPPPPSSLNAAVSAEMDRIVMKALSKDLRDRYQSAAEMAADMHAELAVLTESEHQETLVLPSSWAAPRTASAFGSTLASLQTRVKPLLRSRAAASAGLAALIAAIVVGWWILAHGSYQPAPDARRWYQEGVTALRDCAYYKASKALERAVASDPHFAMAHARLAEAWMELDYADKAREEMLRAAPPGGAPHLSRVEQDYLQAVHLTLTGDFSLAAARFREVVSATPDPDKANAYVDLGRAYERNEQPKEAVAAYLESTRRQPQEPGAWLRLGILYTRQSDRVKAATAFAQAESLYGSLSNIEGVAETLYQRAVLAGKLGKADEAYSLLQQADEKARGAGSVPQHIVILLQLSGVAHRLNDSPAAQRYAAEALELAGVNGLESLTTRSLIDLGNVYFLRGEFDEARKYFTQSLEYARRYHSGRNEARALLSLGSLAMQIGAAKEGLSDVEQALTWYRHGGYQKEEAQALILIGRARRDQGDYPAALASFQEQLQIARKLQDQSQVSISLQGIGSVLDAQERWPEAVARYREAYETSNKLGDASTSGYNLLGESIALWQLGRYEEARQAIAQIAPGNSRDLAFSADRVKASIDLSQRRFAPVIETTRRLLAQPGPKGANTAATLILSGLAQAQSGAPGEAVASTAQALELAAKLNSPRLIAESRAAHAEALLAAGNPPEALKEAIETQPWFAAAGRQAAEWRCWLTASRAAAAMNDPARSRDYAAKASDLLAGLEKRWDAESYKTYLARPDVQFARAQLVQAIHVK